MGAGREAGLGHQAAASELLALGLLLALELWCESEGAFAPGVLHPCGVLTPGLHPGVN